MSDSALFDLSGRTICVTGASSGIGRSIATALAEAGGCVVGVARRESALAEWRSATKGETAAIVADVSDMERVAEMAAAVAKPFGPPDILINAAGMNPRRHADEISPAEWRATIDVNLSASFFMAQTLVPAMKANGWGRIVNFASLQTERAFENGIAYGASKGGVGQMTRAMAEAWSRDGIMVNALAPGFFPTELTGPVFGDAEWAAQNAAKTCVGRNGRLEDLHGPAIFLCSPASDYVTGQILFVDGGFTAR